MSFQPLYIFSPAKINLYLHITGSVDNGYHELDSLATFVDIGDEIYIRPAEKFQFHIEGEFANSFHEKERDESPNSSNIIVKTAWSLSRILQKELNIEIKLIKNLPLASGIGGGSSNAAAVISGLLEYWNVSKTSDILDDFLISMGADVPVCWSCAPARMRGLGEILEPAPMMQEVPIILIYPGKPCSTAKVFAHYLGGFRNPITLPHDLRQFEDLVLFLKNQYNDLSVPARDMVPEIQNALHTLESDTGCALARMSGSGSTCFGLFQEKDDAQKAAQIISSENPDWWVRSGWINRSQRY